MRANHALRRGAGRVPPRVGVLGFFGELLLTLGGVVGLFVVWQLWWTGLGPTAEAHEHMIEFYASTAPAAPEPVASSALRTDDVPDVAPVGHGVTLGILVVPEWAGRTQNRMPIVEGVSPDVLDRAFAGHYPESATPGQVGNFSLAGHRRSYGNSFQHVPDLAPGDAVVVETAETWFVYRVTRHDVVTPDRVDVVAPVPEHPGAVPTERLLTLTTCHSLRYGAFGNDHRWIVHAKLEGWLPRAAGTPDVVAHLEAP
ncbi:class E sortase [Sanguibacter sp. A247]|uniref:class E sortase n=1 Tax=unclassified Sanguibacter TaxID=2645534 RepID=UPI003FD87D45